MPLSKEKLAEHLKGDEPGVCPYCKSDYVEVDRIEQGGDQPRELIQCHECHYCGALWADSYVRTGIHEIFPPAKERHGERDEPDDPGMDCFLMTNDQSILFKPVPGV